MTDQPTDDAQPASDVEAHLAARRAARDDPHALPENATNDDGVHAARRTRQDRSTRR